MHWQLGVCADLLIASHKNTHARCREHRKAPQGSEKFSMRAVVSTRKCLKAATNSDQISPVGGRATPRTNKMIKIDWLSVPHFGPGAWKTGKVLNQQI